MTPDDRTCEAEDPSGTGRFLDRLLAGTGRVAFATDERGRLTWWNDRLSAMTGREPVRLDGLAATGLFATDPTECRDGLCDAVAGDQAVTLPVGTADGRGLPHEFDGTAEIAPGGGSYLYVGRPSGGPPRHEGDVAADPEASDVEDDSEGPVRHRRVVETVRDGVFTLDEDWYVVDANRPLASMLGYDRSTLVGKHAAELIAPDGSIERARETRAALDRGEVESWTVRLTVVRADGARFPAEVRYGRFTLPDGGVGAVGVVRDVTEREEREARLRRRDQLARLNRIGDAAAAALDPVLEAGSREEIERRVCERLADTDLYEVVWGGRPGGEGTVVPHVTQGAAPAFHEVAERLVEGSDHVRSADRAFRRGEPVVHHEGWQREAAEAVRDAADGTDLRATMAIPLAYRGTTYGSLTVYSTREDAFFEAEQEALLRLGRAVGFAINAVGTRRIVHAHEGTELEFRVGPSSSVLAAVSAAVDAECVLRWTAPATGPDPDCEGSTTALSGGSLHDLRLRVAVEGTDAAADAVLDAAEGAGAVDARVVDETGTGCILDLRATESVPSYVVAAGARPREVVADGGHARVVAEAPADVDIRSVVEAFTDATDAELIAKRDSGRADRPPGDRLTEKQREALRIAQGMGYFDWPREHTAEEVADRLGVASATFHYHLRGAQRTLVREVLDSTEDAGEPGP